MVHRGLGSVCLSSFLFDSWIKWSKDKGIRKTSAVVRHQRVPQTHFSGSRQIHRCEVCLHCLGFFCSEYPVEVLNLTLCGVSLRTPEFCFPPCPSKLKSLEACNSWVSFSCSFLSVTWSSVKSIKASGAEKGLYERDCWKWKQVSIHQKQLCVHCNILNLSPLENDFNSLLEVQGPYLKWSNFVWIKKKE